MSSQYEYVLISLVIHIPKNKKNYSQSVFYTIPKFFLCGNLIGIWSLVQILSPFLFFLKEEIHKEISNPRHKLAALF